MKNVLEYKRALTVLGAAFTAVSGACWGYVYASTELSNEFEDRVQTAIDLEVDKARRFYATRYKDFAPEDVSNLGPEDFANPEEPPVVSERQIIIPEDLLTTEAGREKVRQALQGVVAEREVAVEAEEDDAPDAPYYDEAELIAARSSEAPYIVSRDEFLANEAHYEVFQLTYFETDGALLDDQDETIPDTQQTVGDENLERFGVMSGNNNTVYVQNDQSEALFEITRSRMSASEALYGAQASEESIIEHSSMKSRRRGRDDH